VSKGRRTFNLRLVKATWPYTVQEIATLFGVHKNLISRWLGQGLAADRSRRPYLIRGDELVRFLTARQEARRHKCAATEFFCFRCRAARSTYLNIVDVKIQSPTRFRVTGLCSICSTPVSKIQSMKNFEKIVEAFHVQQLAGRHLMGCSDPGVNGDVAGTK
jgi:hypothetical protein